MWAITKLMVRERGRPQMTLTTHYEQHMVKLFLCEPVTVIFIIIIIIFWFSSGPGSVF